MYCNCVWGINRRTSINKLLLVQKKLVRIITGSHYLEQTNELFHQLGILKISDLNKYLTACYAFKKDSLGQMPYLEHSHNTRSAGRYALPVFQRLSSSQNSLSYAVPTLWNSIPTQIRNSSSLVVFKRNYRHYLLQPYLPQSI